jgi:hypothetical protein
MGKKLDIITEDIDEKEIRKIYAEKIKGLRTSISEVIGRRFTQHLLGIAVDAQPSTVFRWESETGLPSTKHLVALYQLAKRYNIEFTLDPDVKAGTDSTSNSDVETGDDNN